MPILGSDRVLGSIVLENYERENAFGESEVRLLSTVAASMGIALENARLFDETQRLLKETEQRAAELRSSTASRRAWQRSSISKRLSIWSAISCARCFNTGDIGIRWYDAKANILYSPYDYEHGVRLSVKPVTPRAGGPWFKLMQARQPLVYKNQAEMAAEGVTVIPGTDASLSSVRVPILGGDRVLGSIILESFERENAYGEAEVRLLSTVAASMGVALENARLFDETQRLLKETEQRNAELAIINSVQAALAAELNIQGIYDSVGDKIREIFQNRDMGIRIYDPKTDMIHYPYTYENGQRLDARFRAPRWARIRRACPPHPRDAGHQREHGASHGRSTVRTRCRARKTEKSAVLVPMVVGDQARGIISMADVEHEHAFSESDVRLLQTLANSMSVALENARLFDETQRLFKESEQRAAELAIINSVQAGARRRAQHPGHLRRGRRQDPQYLQQGRRRHTHLRPGNGDDALPIHLRKRQAARDRFQRRWAIADSRRTSCALEKPSS